MLRETAPNPVLVEVRRDPMVESVHRGAACACTADGDLLAVWGDIDAPVPPRSAIKPLQALPLVESGAADAFGFGPPEIALTCASHSGTEQHVAVVAAMLDRIGLGENALACGGHSPLHGPSADALLRSGRRWSRLHDNCSGKHAGFLATAVHLGEAVEGYHLPDHPVQRRIAALLEDLAGVDVAALPRGIDGCGIPVWGLPLRALATAMARLAVATVPGSARADAARRITAAMAAHPDLIAGPGRFDTEVIAATGGQLLAKGGAEGVQVAMVPDAGIGIAVKIDDGGGRAAGVALGGVLRSLDLLSEGVARALAGLLRPSLTTRTGAPVGSLAPASVFDRARAI